MLVKELKKVFDQSMVGYMDLAKAVGISRSHLYRKLNGQRKMSVDEAERIANQLKRRLRLVRLRR